MSLIFDALQQMGHNNDDFLKQEQKKRVAKRKVYTLRRLFFSPAIILILGGIILAGILAVQLSPSLSKRIASTSSVIQKIPSPVTVPESSTQDDRASVNNPANSDSVLSDADHVNALPLGVDQQAEALAEDAHASFQVRYYAPVQPEVNPSHSDGQTRHADKTASSLLPNDRQTQSMAAKAAEPEVEFFQVRYQAPVQPEVNPSHSDGQTSSFLPNDRQTQSMAAKTAQPEAEKIMAMKQAQGVHPTANPAAPTTPMQPLSMSAGPSAKSAGPPNEQKGTADLPYIASNTVRDQIAEQTAHHLQMARLVDKIKGAIQTESHQYVAELFKQLETLQKPNSLFVFKLKAYWEIRRGNIDQARIISKG